MSGLDPIVIDFGLLIIGAMVLGGVAFLFRQPLILAYIAAGILLGGAGFGLIHNQDYLYSVASQLGIAMLLFVVGLELSIKKMFEVRKVVTFGTLAKSLLMMIAGMFAAYFLGFTFMEGIYIGLSLAFASTLLVVKMIGEKSQIDTIAGRIMVGSLVFEDILVIVAISFLGVVAGVEPTGVVKWFISLPGVSLFPYIQNIALLVGAILLFVLAYLTNRFIARHLFRLFSPSVEMLFVTSLGFLFISAFIAGELGFSTAIGAFIAGVIVANTDHYLDVLGRVKTLATFFALLFFATLGFKVSFNSFTSLLIPILVFTLIVVILKPIMIGIMVGLFGYDKRTSISVALHMSQISEFSLILITFGIQFKHVREELLTIIIFVLLFTFIISSYYSNYSNAITNWLQRRFKSLAPDQKQLAEAIAQEHATVVVYGVENIDDKLLKDIVSTGKAIVVDPDPVNVDYLRAAGIPCMLGQLGNEEVLEKLDIHHIKIVISTVDDYEENLFVTEHIRRVDPTTVFVAPAAKVKQALSLYEHGATYVLVTSFFEDATLQLILGTDNHAQLAKLREAQLSRLKKTASRRHGAIDIDHFVAELANQPFKAGKKAFEQTTKFGDHIVRKMSRKK